MFDAQKEEISSFPGKEFTQITFTPDFKKFGMKRLESDLVDIIKKRTYDMAGVLGAKVNVKFNGKDINIKGFSDYVDMYLNKSSMS